MSKAANRYQRRTATADLALRRARAKANQLRDDPTKCICLWDHIALPIVPPQRSAEARRLFRQHIGDAAFRRGFVEFAYDGTVRQYESGELGERRSVGSGVAAEKRAEDAESRRRPEDAQRG